MEEEKKTPKMNLELEIKELRQDVEKLKRDVRWLENTVKWMRKQRDSDHMVIT